MARRADSQESESRTTDGERDDNVGKFSLCTYLILTIVSLPEEFGSRILKHISLLPWLLAPGSWSLGWVPFDMTSLLQVEAHAQVHGFETRLVVGTDWGACRDWTAEERRQNTVLP